MNSKFLAKGTNEGSKEDDESKTTKREGGGGRELHYRVASHKFG